MGKEIITLLAPILSVSSAYARGYTNYSQVLANIVNCQPVIDLLWNGWNIVYDSTIY